jgi:AcrR family transcriptional regulator
MQAKRPRISNEERSQAMRRALLEAGRALFVAKSYTETSTPDIVAAAGVTRGALYHHFEDKNARSALSPLRGQEGALPGGGGGRG